MASVFKLLMTTDNSYEVRSYTNTLCEVLSQNMNIEICLVSINSKSDQIDELKFRSYYLNEDLSCKENIFEYKNTCLSCEEALKSIIDDFNPHLVHLNHYLCSYKIDKPTVLVAHDDILNKVKWTQRRGRNYPVDTKYKYYKTFLKDNLNNADIIITKSKFNAESLGRTYNFNNRIKVIYNAIDDKVWEEKSPEPYLLTSIQSHRANDLNLLLNMSSKLPDTLKIFALSDNPIEKNKPSNLEILSDVQPLEKMNLYRRASIYLALSSWDTFYTSLIKAAYSNCAIVANDIPLFKELWGDCASIFERNNLNSLVKNINNLVENSALLDKTARECQNKALCSFNTKRMCFQYINLYKNLLKEWHLQQK